jgi:ribosome-binding protein aMBF1 (putative translation factor)
MEEPKEPAKIPYSYSLEYKKEYYQRHREKIAKSNAELVVCKVCGKTVTKQRMNKHYSTAACQKARLQKQQNEIPQMKKDIEELKKQYIQIMELLDP